MTAYNKIFKLKRDGFNHSEIALKTETSRKTVITTLQLAEKLGFTWSPDTLSDTDIHRILHPKRTAQAEAFSIEKALFLTNIPSISDTSVWKLYADDTRNDGAVPYSKSQFQNKLNEARSRVTLPEYQPGLLFKYMPNVIKADGTTYGILASESTGSHFITAVLIEGNKQRNWAHGLTHIIKRLGVVPDTAVFMGRQSQNIRTVTEACLGYYGIKVEYTGLVEGAAVNEFMAKAVSVLYKSKGMDLFLVLNAFCGEFNEKDVYDNLHLSRREACELESLFLSKPCTEDFDLVESKDVTPKYNHVRIDGIYYSVPFRNRHDNLTAYISDYEISIYAGREEICRHRKLAYGNSRYSTNPDHLPDGSETVWGETTGASLRSWAKSIGEYTEKTINYWLKKVKYECQAYRTCDALLHMTSRYSKEMIEEVCRKMWKENRKVAYRAIADALKTTT